MTQTLRNEGAGRPIAPGTAPRTLRLTADWIAVRELPPPAASTLLVVAPTGTQPGTVIQGVIESVGPGRRTRAGVVLPVELEVGQTVYFPAEAGRARLPWDYPVRVMREGEVSGVVESEWWALENKFATPGTARTPDDGHAPCCDIFEAGGCTCTPPVGGPPTPWRTGGRI